MSESIHYSIKPDHNVKKLLGDVFVHLHCIWEKRYHFKSQGTLAKDVFYGTSDEECVADECFTRWRSLPML